MSDDVAEGYRTRLTLAYAESLARRGMALEMPAVEVPSTSPQRRALLLATEVIALLLAIPTAAN